MKRHDSNENYMVDALCAKSLGFNVVSVERFHRYTGPENGFLGIKIVDPARNIIENYNPTVDFGLSEVLLDRLLEYGEVKYQKLDSGECMVSFFPRDTNWWAYAHAANKTEGLANLYAQIKCGCINKTVKQRFEEEFPALLEKTEATKALAASSGNYLKPS